MSSSSSSMNNSDSITETITTSNTNDIVESLYNNDGTELIGYSCKQVLEKNTVEAMDLVFYMDILSPNTSNEGNVNGNDNDIDNNGIDTQAKAIEEAQKVILQEISKQYQIDPNISKGVRCFDLPVDGSTWLVQLSIDTRDFKEVTLFGGCRELEWDAATQDCKFYETRLKGSYIGAVSTDEDGIMFSDVVAVLENLINGPKVVQNLNKQQNQQNGNNNNNNNAIDQQQDQYDTAFLGVPRVEENPNFQGGADEGRDDLKDPVNINTGIDASQSMAQPNRKTITVVGGLLVGCFSIAFIMVGYVLFRRRRSYNRSRKPNNNNNNNNNANNNNSRRDTDLAVLDGGLDGDEHNGNNNNNNINNNAFAEHYNLDKGSGSNGNGDDIDATHVGGDNDQEDEGLEGYTPNGRDALQDDEPIAQHRQQQQQQQKEEYPNLPMSAEAIQMDLGNSLKGQLMGLHGNTNGKNNVNANANNTGGPYGCGMPVNMVGGSTSVDGNESDEVDSWAQTDGTIGSLELQLEPITAEV